MKLPAVPLEIGLKAGQGIQAKAYKIPPLVSFPDTMKRYMSGEDEEK
jgi:hypothetical protein